MSSRYKVLFFLAVAAVFISFLSASEPVRVWRTKQGGEIKAVWDRENSSDTTVSLVRNANSKTYTVPVDNLSDEDQRYVREERARERGMTVTGPQSPGPDSDKPTSYPKEPSRKIALLVGTNRYDNLESKSQLSWCISDVLAVEKRLEEIGFARENITSLTDPTDAEIETALQNLEKKITKGDLVFLFFSGHGRNIGKSSYYCPKNIEPTPDLPHAVSVIDIIERIGKKHAFLKYFVFDMCRDSGSEPELSNVPNRSVVSFACSDGEQSNEVEELGHGLYCYFLLEGLRGNADTDKNGEIRPLELHEFMLENAIKKVKELNAKKRPGERRLVLQHPQVKNDLGDLALYPFVTNDKYGVKRTKRIRGIDGREIALTFCWCPAGKYEILDDTSLNALFENRLPKKGTLSGFWILESEVTQEMWRSVMGNWDLDRRISESGALNTKTQVGIGSKFPMCCVTWQEVKQFCDRLSAHLNEKVTLPTEAQWAYASLGGTENGYSDRLKEMAWYKYDSGETIVSCQMHEVKTRLANAWGIYDMYGNVDEWCSDPASPGTRVTKGGNWSSLSQYCHPGPYDYQIETNCMPTLGFRPVLIPTGKEFREGYLSTDQLRVQ